jgi:hypothetical protein
MAGGIMAVKAVRSNSFKHDLLPFSFILNLKMVYLECSALFQLKSEKRKNVICGYFYVLSLETTLHLVQTGKHLISGSYFGCF